MFGIVDNKVESVKLIGGRDVDMNTKIRSLFDEMDRYKYYPYFNDAKALFIISVVDSLLKNGVQKTEKV